METIKVLQITMEMSPFAKAGGLADVCAALPKWLNKRNIDIKVMMPLFPKCKEILRGKLKLCSTFNINFRNKKVNVKLFTALYEGIDIYFVQPEHYFFRNELYGYDDEFERFIILTKSVLESIPLLNFIPNILHYHDWHMGFLPIYMRKKYIEKNPIYRKMKTVLTIHNFDYQGIFPIKGNIDLLDISRKDFSEMQLEFFGQINFMKAGILYSDAVTTVSRQYAIEIEAKMHDLDINTNKRIFGIVNGLDLDVFNPETDNCVNENYSILTFEKAKRINKREIQKEVGFEINDDIPMIIMIARLIRDKGYDLVECIYKDLLKENIQLIVMGDGDEYYKNLFRRIEKENHLKFRIFKYDDIIARKLYSAADMFLMPSHYEPCGTTQLISMRYGVVPIVRKTGGLVDTVTDFDEDQNWGNGFVFIQDNAWIMLYTIKKAIEKFSDKDVWKKIIVNAMKSPLAWDEVIDKYIEIYTMENFRI